MNGATVKVYSRAKNGLEKLSSNFKVNEFACQDSTDTVFVAPELVTVLQKIRDHFGAAVTISSGYRTEAHNKAVGGAAYSQHKYGMPCFINRLLALAKDREYALRCIDKWTARAQPKSRQCVLSASLYTLECPTQMRFVNESFDKKEPPFQTMKRHPKVRPKSV